MSHLVVSRQNPSACERSCYGTSDDRRATSGRPSSLRLLRGMRLSVVMAVAMICVCSSMLRAGLLDEAANEPFEVTEVSLGFDGFYKIGFWTAVSVTLETNESTTGQLRIIAPDGDGNESSFLIGADTSSLGADSPTTLQGLIRVGRLNAPLRIQWLNEDGQVQFERPLDDEIDTTGLNSSVDLVVSLGVSETVESAVDRMGSADAEIVYVEITDSGQLPSTWVAWEMVDALSIATGDTDRLTELDATRQSAMIEWVHQGGRVVISVGRNSEALFEPGSLVSQLAPGDFLGVVEHSDSAGIETYAVSNEQLLPIRGATISICRIGNVVGSVDVYEGRDETDLPIVIHASKGFGRVAFVTFDFDDAHFVDWGGQRRFLTKVFDRERTSSVDRVVDSRGGRVSHIGYSDMSGQLRSAMDQFGGVQLITFTWVAVLVVLFILCIGPADYFLLKKVVRRMEYTWITFAIFVILFSSVAVVIAHYTKRNEVQVNQVEVVDIDLSTSTVRGTLWATVYSPTSTRYRVGMSPTRDQSTIEPRDRLIGWQGLPGTGLGGMDSSVMASVIGQPYRIDTEADDEGLTSMMESVPIQVSSTKTFAGRWSGSFGTGDFSDLELDLRTDTLSGTITNPLDVPLERGVILFGNWAFVLKESIEPGETVSISADATERTLDGYLARRRLTEGRDVATPWDPTDIDVHRILELLLFHEVSGGRDYTGLTQRLHGNIDLSDHLVDDRAVLFAKGPERAMDLQLDGKPVSDQYDKTWTYYRIVFPVVNPYLRNEP